MSFASGIEIRLLRPDDDVDAELDLRRRAFGPISSGQRGAWVTSIQHSIAGGELVGAFDGRALIGSARFHPMRQWWRGRAMPMAGVAGVKVAPEERGRGVGRALMLRLIAEIADRGYPVSTLLPATVPLYRSLGWEFAGSIYETRLPVTALAGLIGPDEAAGPELSRDGAPRAASAAAPSLRRTGAVEAAAVIQTLGRVYSARGDFRPATHEPGVVARWLDDEDFFAYLADDGFLGYRWSRDTDSIKVELLAAASAQTARAFWQILASHGSMADTVHVRLSPDDPVNWLTREPAAVTRQLDGWMLRLVDAGAAVAARGFPSAVSVSVPLDITDDVCPVNSGRWDLQVAGGQGRLGPADSCAGSAAHGMARGAAASAARGAHASAAHGAAGSAAGRAAGSCTESAADGGPLRLGARGLAALYGGVPVSTLRRSGLAAGGSAAADDALDSAFGGRPAFMLHGF